MPISGKLPSGHTYQELEGEEAEALQKNYAMNRDGFVVANPGNFYLPKGFLHFADSLYNLEVKPGDVFVITYPKSGTNWMQEIVWNLVDNPDLNNPDADTPIDSRCPYFGIDYLFYFKSGPQYDPNGKLLKTFYEHFPDKDPLEDGVMLHLAKIQKEPRLLKDHVPYTFLPPDLLTKAKIICLARDPRDVLVSSYHYHKLQTILTFTGNLEEFTEDFMQDKVPFPFGPYWEHMRLHWEIRNHPNFLLVFYEDLKENPKAEFRKIDKFLGTNRTDEQIENIIKYTSFSNMKEKTKHNPPTSFDNNFFSEEEVKKGGSFFRKGKAGSWKEDLPPNLQKKVNLWVKENLAQFGDDFKYKAEFRE